MQVHLTLKLMFFSFGSLVLGVSHILEKGLPFIGICTIVYVSIYLQIDREIDMSIYFQFLNYKSYE